jgi:hypothetical protein
VKYLAVIVMTATVFPAYGIARMVVGRPAALFAAAAAAAIPAFAYSSMIVEEPLAYPYSTLCLYLILRVLVRPTRLSIGAALVASAIAPLIRGELRGNPGRLRAVACSSSRGPRRGSRDCADPGRRGTGSGSASSSSAPLCS